MSSKPHSPDDATLLKRIARGDMQAFDALYQRHSAALYTYILRLTRNQQQAEDILQETFIAVWRNAHQYTGRAQVRSWLFSIAHRRTMDWIRSVANVNETEAGDTIEEWLMEDQHSSDPAWEPSASYGEEIRLALDDLSPEHRAVIELAFYYDLSYVEIAEVLGCPLGTVKSRIYAARQQLQKALSHLSRAKVWPGGGQ